MVLQQVVPCFFLTREYSVSSVKMVIAGGRKGTEELLEKHMNDLRFCIMQSFHLNSFFYLLFVPAVIYQGVVLG